MGDLWPSAVPNRLGEPAKSGINGDTRETDVSARKEYPPDD